MDPYETPSLVRYGLIGHCTFMTPGGNVKGGDPCYHLDKFDEMSGISPGLCEGGEGLFDPDNRHNDGMGEVDPNWIDDHEHNH